MKAQKELGEEAATALHARLADLEAADTITDVSWVQMDIGPTTVAVRFHPDYRLIIEANEANPSMEGGAIRWDKVDRLLIRRVEQV